MSFWLDSTGLIGWWWWWVRRQACDCALPARYLLSKHSILLGLSPVWCVGWLPVSLFPSFPRSIALSSIPSAIRTATPHPGRDTPPLASASPSRSSLSLQPNRIAAFRATVLLLNSLSGGFVLSLSGGRISQPARQATAILPPFSRLGPAEVIERGFTGRVRGFVGSVQGTRGLGG
ncbi:hypothetical protein EJ06DRAFT_74392 [Trichodelitschia bisporula]|uniref:Uncharacterized protein n=1 Tax=Trichodelitschia bisporula TaxID=703511 RepID=A0A6G1HTI4_9PEZI|nr:hypothetical protein EJ06DRAFT_74392 [Trichodelitschia bisporula]